MCNYYTYLAARVMHRAAAGGCRPRTGVPRGAANYWRCAGVPQHVSSADLITSNIMMLM